MQPGKADVCDKCGAECVGKLTMKGEVLCDACYEKEGKGK